DGTPPTPTQDSWPDDSTSTLIPSPTPPEGLRRRRHRRPLVGYTIDSGDEQPVSECSYSSSSEPDDDERSPFLHDHDPSFSDDDTSKHDHDQYHNHDAAAAAGIIRISQGARPGSGWTGSIRISQAAGEWLALALQPGILPQYTEKIEVPDDKQELTLLERILASFTVYAELKAARTEEEFGRVFGRLQVEWGYVGGIVCLLHPHEVFIHSFLV
ncbi:hypothetical protein DXG03_006298, partial [Asterophora parasitica]